MERQVLEELDPTVATADKSSIQEQLNATQPEAFRTRELIEMLLNKDLSMQLSLEQSASFFLSSFTPALQTAVLAQLHGPHAVGVNGKLQAKSSVKCWQIM